MLEWIDLRAPLLETVEALAQHAMLLDHEGMLHSPDMCVGPFYVNNLRFSRKTHDK